MALLSVIALAFTSCSNDDDDLLQSNIEFKNVEFGHKNSKTGTIGDDLHLECDIKSGSKIQSVEVVLSKDGKNVIKKTYTDSKYVGVLNTKFHEHIDLPETLAEGKYQCFIIVKNEEKKIDFVSAEITLKKKAVDPKAPKIANLKVDKMESTVNGKVTFTADIETVAKVQEIEIEFHGDKETEIEVDDLNGKTGKLTFKKEVTIPAECKAGKYHIHFTVKDAEGRETTEEIEGFTIK